MHNLRLFDFIIDGKIVSAHWNGDNHKQTLHWGGGGGGISSDIRSDSLTQSQ